MTAIAAQQPGVQNLSLYRAQAMANEALATDLFPRYSSTYIQSQQGFKGKMLWLYDKTCDGADALNRTLQIPISGVQYGASKILSIGDRILGRVVRPMLDVAYPVNPINGRRHFVGVSRNVEKKIGDWILYPLATLTMQKTNKCLPGSNQAIADKVEQTFRRLVDANGELLNPRNETTRFDYRVKTMLSSQINAFAVAGGGMVVFSQLVEELEGAIRSLSIREATVHFADGSTTTVDLTNVTLDDALAAVLGHEITHAASRHSIGAVATSIVLSILMTVSNLTLFVLGLNDQRFSRLRELLMKLQELIQNVSRNFHAHKHEYEADVTGAYFTRQAGFNPLGAIYLQEFFKQQQGGLRNFLRRYLEFTYTHPYVEKRKRAVFAAINEIDPQALRGRVGPWVIADNGYDLARSSSGIRYAREHQANVLPANTQT